MLAFRKREPILRSLPTANEISPTSAPVFSHRADTELIEEMRWARKALATSLESSADHRLVVMILSAATQWAKMSTISRAAASPAGVWREPISTRSGSSRSRTADPSARNSGLETTSKWMFFLFSCRIRSMASAVRTGRVLFSTMILGVRIGDFVRFSQHWIGSYAGAKAERPVGVG
jgi:hypothetical protein